MSLNNFWPSLVCCFYLWHLTHLCHARVYSDPQAVANMTYDFIIVGGGTAGSVIANRLSETNSSVLLIEAGPSNLAPPDNSSIQVPFLVSAAAGSIYDWNFTTIAQFHLDDRILTYPRGFVLGGSSSINFMAYTRGPSTEYDRLAKFSGDPGWSWKNMFRYALKSEKHVESADHHNTTGQFDPSLHGTSGPLLTSLPGEPTDIDQRILNTTVELASDFPFRLDMNGGNPLGIAWLQSTIGGGVRSSSATAYLEPIENSTRRLDILVQTRVTRVLATLDGKNRIPNFRTVEFTNSRNGTLYQLTARNEVILSAGSIGTPQLLMLSGIGDSQDLARVGINSTVDLPNVGKNLQDHPYITIPWSVNSTKTFDTVVFNQTLFAELLQEYEQDHMDIFANNAIANQIGFFRLPNSSDILRNHGDPSSGPVSPHFELAFCNGFVATTQTSPTSGNFFSIAVVLVAPSSHGSVRINSSSIFDPPLINPNYLATPGDMLTMVEAVKTAQHFITASPWKGYIESPFGDAAQLNNDSEIMSYIRSKAISIRHPVATARMSKDSDSCGVVGPDLLVKGVTGLRVVDASVLPFAPSSHPQASSQFPNG
ncbi:aryl-alcohol oxidase-like protein [Infundibulicybe gibba]|nr:aryl-alcohol oxidase-like protein [Infundibulicybe gibba]